MEDTVIEIARFEHATEAEMLAGLLKSEGIECYVRDGISSNIMFGGVDIGGAKVDILKKDAQHALEIMKDHNYEITEEFRVTESDGSRQNYNEVHEIEKHEAGENKTRLSKYMTIIIVLMFILFGALVFLNKYYNG